MLDTDLKKCARYHCDKHVVKMPIEYAQLLSSALVHYGHDAPYKETHKNHPCAIWVRKYEGNYTLLYDLAIEVGKEYTRRYGKVHKSTQALDNVPRILDMGQEVTQTSPLPNCTTIKGIYPELNLVDKYRIYYMRDKAHILTFKNTEEPHWMGERFYRQQIESIGHCPGSTKQPNPPKKLKIDYAAEIGVVGVDKLTMADLVTFSEFKNPNVKLVLPEGRLKKPYVAQLELLCPDVDYSKLTVSVLKLLIEKFS